MFFFISRCSLSEDKFLESNITGWNGRIEGDYIFKRLDRVMVNNSFLDYISSLEVRHLIREGSDYASLHLICNLEERVTIKPFRFLNFWTKHT